MKLKDFKALLEGRDEEMEVVVQVRENPNLDGEVAIEDGDLLDVFDERSVTVSYGNLTIIADQRDD